MSSIKRKGFLVCESNLSPLRPPPAPPTMAPSFPATYGSVGASEPSIEHTPRANRLMTRAWSMHGEYEVTQASAAESCADERLNQLDPSSPISSFSNASVKTFVYYIVYAIVNVIISVPGLYGYAAVIFNHEVFAPHMNALSKLVIFSSLMHQLSFTAFSSLNTFAIGTVQDAGLIFLSSMSNRIAETILDRDGGTEQQVVSTVLVLLSLGTATLGLVLIAMGHFRLAELVPTMVVFCRYCSLAKFFFVALIVTAPSPTCRCLLSGDIWHLLGTFAWKQVSAWRSRKQC